MKREQSTPDPYYNRDGNQYILHIPMGSGKYQQHPRGDTVAIGYTRCADEPHTTVLHVHGQISVIQAWADRTRKAYLEAGFKDMATEVQVIESNNWDLTDLNKFLSTTGYFGLWLEKNKLAQ